MPACRSSTSHPPHFPLLRRITRILTNGSTLAGADFAIHRQFHNSETKVSIVARARWIIRWPLRRAGRKRNVTPLTSFLPSFRPMSVRSSCQPASHVSLSLRLSRNGPSRPGTRDYEDRAPRRRRGRNGFLFILVAFVLMALLPESTAARQ